MDEELTEARQDLEKYGVKIVRKEPVPKQEDYREEYK
jgi:hypothetical protein